MWNISLFGSASHFANIGSSKAGSHTSNSLLLKAQSQQLLTCNTSLRSQLRDQTSLLLCIWQVFFCSCNEGMSMIQPWFNAEMAERTRLSGSSSFWQGVDAWNSQRNSGNGFLKQTCGTYLFSAVHHILRTSAAERLAAPLPNHRC